MGDRGMLGRARALANTAPRYLRDAGASLPREMRAALMQGRLVAGTASAARAASEPFASTDEERLVVFVHGFLSLGPVFAPMRERVESALGVRTAVHSYGPLASFEEIAEGFAQFVDGLARPRRRVAIVGHSLGGLVARWYLQERGGLAQVDRLITLATPHEGTLSALLLPGSLARALRPGSRVLRRLEEGRWRATHVRHVSFVAGADLMVTPPSSAASLDDAEVEWFDGVGHNEMLFHEDVFARVVAALGE